MTYYQPMKMTISSLYLVVETAFVNTVIININILI
jgi:hypothetical protein